jgi:matrixin
VGLEGGPADLVPADCLDAANQAIGTYAHALGGMATGMEVSMAGGQHGQATIHWVNEKWDDEYDPTALAVTVMKYDTSSGEITGGDIAVNGSVRWTATDACWRAYDLQGVLTHELGHLFGLAHDPRDPSATMYPTAGQCETLKRDLAASDLGGLQYLYEDTPPPEGCGVAPGGHGSGAASLVAGMAVLAWIFRRRAAAAASLVLLAGAAHATTVVRLSLDDAHKVAPVVVRARVLTVAPVVAGDRVYTDAVVQVAECVKGACAPVYVVRQLGGEAAGRGMTVEGSAALNAGEETILYLRPRRDGAWAPLGMAQGVVHIERDRVTGEVKRMWRDLRGLETLGD